MSWTEVLVVAVARGEVWLCTHNLTSAHTQLENATLKGVRNLCEVGMGNSPKTQHSGNINLLQRASTG
ncbi:hypothetical protein RIF29_24477 [Crotalaria pallida]|uniref:Uncharacterized protein n=1 Tax=Crotalaria pallida TaxID=3830 RepID=A0AAN9ES29_CROPI